MLCKLVVGKHVFCVNRLGTGLAVYICIQRGRVLGLCLYYIRDIENVIKLYLQQFFSMQGDSFDFPFF